MPKKLSRAAAKQLKRKRYWTGKPCVRGHIALRITASGSCHQCVLDDKQFRRSRKPGYRTRLEMDAKRDASMRRCAKCQKMFPSTAEFFVLLRKGDWTGFAAECRRCRNKRFAPYYKKHRKQLIKRATETTRDFRQTPEGKEKNRLWAREGKRRQFADLKERKKATDRDRAWRKAHPGKVLEFSHRNRARRNGVEGSWTAAEFAAVLKRQKYKCFFCGCDIRDEHHREHLIPITRGGSNWISNIRGSCRSCNLRKHNKTPDEFRRYLKEISRF